MSKIGRNALCPCGSGKKYKRCHGSFEQQDQQTDLRAEVRADVDRMRKQLEATTIQREKQQGLGRPIVSHVSNGHRFVAVGTKLHWQKEERWRTFHVFLSDHFLSCLGSKWVAKEKRKPAAERHTLIKWLEQSGADLAKYSKSEGGVRTGPMTGAIRAYLTLAYNIYLIAHNTLPQGDAIVRSYVKRLKSTRSGDFVGAVFETYAAAAFLKAGFALEFENERDGSTSHVEFVATHPETGKKFSVEVKARDWTSASSCEEPGIRRLRVASKLNQALAKQAQHTRVVFIEINVPEIIETCELTGWLEGALQEIRQNERKPDVNQKSAYVIVTNHAFHSNLDAINAGAQVLATGFNIPDFGPDVQFGGYKAVLEMRERHVEIISLMRSMEAHYEIPASFDGEMSDLAFVDDGLPRLRFGNVYLVPDKNGREVAGRLYEATVVDKLVYGVFELATGQHILASVPISDAELAAYRRHPETFFGEVRRPSRQCSSFVEFCDFFYEGYQNTDRDRLLEFMSGARDYDQVRRLPQKELAIIYAERCAWTAFNSSKKKEPKAS